MGGEQGPFYFGYESRHRHVGMLRYYYYIISTGDAVVLVRARAGGMRAAWGNRRGDISPIG